MQVDKYFQYTEIIKGRISQFEDDCVVKLSNRWYLVIIPAVYGPWVFESFQNMGPQWAGSLSDRPLWPQICYNYL